MDKTTASYIFGGLTALGAGLIFIGSGYFGINGTVQSSCIAIITAIVSFFTGSKIAKKGK